MNQEVFDLRIIYLKARKFEIEQEITEAVRQHYQFLIDEIKSFNEDIKLNVEVNWMPYDDYCLFEWNYINKTRYIDINEIRQNEEGEYESLDQYFWDNKEDKLNQKILHFIHYFEENYKMHINGLPSFEIEIIGDIEWLRII